MTSLIPPADYSVAELKEALDDVDDVEALERLLDAERTGENRVTAIDAIEQRLDAVGTDEEVSDDADADVETDERVDPAADRRGPATENGTSRIEEGWSKDTVVGLDRASPSETAATPSGDAAAGSLRSDYAAENGEATAETLDRAPTRAESASLATDEDVGEKLLENIERIRHTFERSTAEDGRVEARIRQLQAEVADLKSYTNALEEFLDEEGTGRQVIESVRADIESLEATLSEVEGDVGIHGRNLGRLWSVVDDVEDELAHLHERLDRQRRDLDSVADDVEQVERAVDEVSEAAAERHDESTRRFESVDEALSTTDDRLSSHDEALDGLGGEVAAVADEVDALGDRADAVDENLRELDATVSERFADSSEERAALTARIEDNAAAVEQLNATVEDLSTTVERLEGLVGDSGSVDERFAAVEDEIQELHEWREQLSSVLLSSAGGDPSSAEP
jgi:DNA repair exonuclease SbcCD ATPase subunit